MEAFVASFSGKGSKNLHANPKAKVTRHVGKGSIQQKLPSRHALNQITGGDPADRNMNQYAKATPSIDETGPSPGTSPQMDGPDYIL
jgi:hypothetical protein